MAAVSDSAYAAILRGVGAPASGINVETLKIWQKYEGGNAKFNPFNTNRSAPGATTYNSHGVKNYPDEATGITATIGALNLPYYVLIRSALKTQQPPAVAGAIVASPWGTKSPSMVAEMTSLPARWVAGKVTDKAQDAVADVTGTATGAAKNVIELSARLNNILERLTHRETWIRVGLFVAGVLLIIYGFFIFFRKPAKEALDKIISLGGTAAKAAVTKGKAGGAATAATAAKGASGAATAATAVKGKVTP